MANIPLPIHTLDYLLPLTQPERSEHLLRALAPGSPLSVSSAFSAEVVGPAHFGLLAWRAGYTKGNLKSLKGYEAQERLGHRMRAARSRSASLQGWGLQLLRGVGCKGDALPADAALWWRGVCAHSDAGFELGMSTWSTLRRSEGMEEVIQAAGLLIDWHRQVRDYSKEEEA